MNTPEPSIPPASPLPRGLVRPGYEGLPYGVPYYHGGDEPAGWLGSLDSLRVLRILRKRWRTLGLAVLAALLLAGLYLAKATRVYESGALVELSTRRPRILAQQAAVIEDPAAGQQSETTLNTQLEKFKSRAILPAVLVCYRAKSPDDDRPEDALSRWLAQGVDFKLIRRTRLVAVTFRDRDPARAAHACAAFAEGAEAQARAENRAASDAAVAWLEAQVKTQRLELEKADQALSEARQLHQLDALEAERKTIQQALLQFNEALVEVESLLAKEQEVLNALEASNLALFRQQADSLRRSKEAQSRRAAELERDILDRESKLASLQCGRNAADLSYQGVLNRIQEARLSADENTASVKLVEEARQPEKPVSPKALRVLALALLMGLLAEAFAGLRSVLDSQAYKSQSKVILVASSLPAEGKTTTCCNLATACARNGQRTLPLDFDLRRPRIAGIYPMPPGARGLLDYLGGSSPAMAELAYATDCPNLSIIASRPVTESSPAELMGGTKVEALIAWARASYDRVILDGPPLGLVSDSLVLAGLSDCVLVVARPSISRKRAVRHTVQRFRDVGVGAIAAVLNDVAASNSHYRDYGPYHLYRQQAQAYFEPVDAGKDGG